MPIGKESGPNCPLDSFRQLEKLFIHGFHLFSVDSPRRGVGIGSLCGAARQGVRRFIFSQVAGGFCQLVNVGGVNAAVNVHSVQIGGGCGGVDGFGPHMSGGGYSTIGAVGRVYQIRNGGGGGGINASCPLASNRSSIGISLNSSFFLRRSQI